MRKRKKRFANFMSLVLVLSMILGNVSTAFASNGSDVSTVNFVTSDGKVSGSKSSKWIDQENGIAEVTFALDVEKTETEISKVTKSNIVLVLDTSGSMDDNSRLKNAKKAANKFIDSILTDDNKQFVDMAVVEFADKDILAKDWTNNRSELTAAVNGLNANGATNIQAGIRKASELIAKKPATDNNIIVLLCDGMPTCSYKGTRAAEDLTTLNSGAAARLITEFDYSWEKGDGQSYTFGEYNAYYGSLKAELGYYKGIGGNWVKIKDLEVNSSDTVGETMDHFTLEYGFVYKRVTSKSETIKNHGIPTISEAEMAKNGDHTAQIYAISYSPSKGQKENAEYVLKNVASNGCYYSSDESEESITKVLEAISEKVSEIVDTGKGAKLSDSVPDYFTVLFASDKLTVTADKKSVIWNIGALKEGYYTASFRIQLDQKMLNAEDVRNAGDLIATNRTDAGGKTTLSYESAVEETTISTSLDQSPMLSMPTYTYSVTYNIEDGSRPEVNGVAFKGDTISYKKSLDDLGLSSAKYNNPVVTVDGMNTSELVIRPNAQNHAVVTVDLKEFKVYFYDAEKNNNPNPIPVVNGQEYQTVKYGKDAVKPSAAQEPVKAGNEQFSYTFAGWNNTFTNVVKDLDIYPSFRTTTNTYPVTFYVDYLDGNGYIEYDVQHNVLYNEKPATPAAPEKSYDSQFSNYAFTGWSEGWDAPVTGPREVRGTFVGEGLKEYDVNFVNDEKTIATQKKKYGENAEKPAEAPTLSGTDYTYEFKGWSEEPGIDYTDTTVWFDFENTEVVRHITLYAKYTKISNPIISFYQADGLDLIYNVTVPYNTAVNLSDIPNAKVIIPEETAQYTFSFNNQWNVLGTEEQADFSAPLTQNLSVKAVINETVKSYPVTFYDLENHAISFSAAEGIDKSEIQQVAYGSSATAPVPGKDFAEAVSGSAIGASTIYFAGWQQSFDNITGPTNVYPNISKDFVVTFIIRTADPDEKGYHMEELLTKTVDAGESLSAPVDVPQTVKTQSTVYTFTGWDENAEKLNSINENLVIYAEYSESPSQYKVTFYDENKVTVLKETQLVDYGIAAVAPMNPEKADSDKYTYEFSGWDKPFDCITEDINVIAQYNEFSRVTVTYYDENNGLLDTVSGKKGFDATVGAPAALEKAGDAQYVGYRFLNWELRKDDLPTGFVPDLTSVNENMDVIATYEGTQLQQYEVKFFTEGWQNQIGETQTVPYGSSAAEETAPEKASTVQYDYTFTGWRTRDNRASAWMYVTGDVEVQAVYQPVIRSYTVTFWNDSEKLGDSTAEYNTPAVPAADPVKEPTQEFSYEFIGWVDKDGSPVEFVNADGENSYLVTADIDVYAVYREIPNLYTVTFADEDEIVFTDGDGNAVASTVLYGDLLDRDVQMAAQAMAERKAAEMSNVRYEYRFAGWMMKNGGSELVSAAEELNKGVVVNYTVYASYTAVRVDDYRITYMTKEAGEENNPIFAEYTAEPGSAHALLNYGPSKADGDYRYTFAAWTAYTLENGSMVQADLSVLSEITQNIYLYPTYNTVKLHTVTFVDYDDTVIKTEKVPDGGNAAAPADPVRPSDEMYNYTFEEWDQDFTKVTEDLTVKAVYTQTEKPAEPTPNPDPTPTPTPSPDPTPDPTYPDTTDPEPTQPTDPSTEPATEPEVPEEIVDIDDEEVPEGAPEIDTTDESDNDDAAVAEGNEGDGGSGEEEVIVDDNEIPEGTPTLPQTGTVDSSAFYFFGLLVTVAGVVVLSLKKKRA